MRYYKYNKSAIFSGQCLGQDDSLIMFTNRDGFSVKLCYAKSCIRVGLIEKNIHMHRLAQFKHGSHM